MRLLFPDHIEIEKYGESKGWSRSEMYDYYCEEVRRLNPRYFHSDGRQKKWWELLIPWI